MRKEKEIFIFRESSAGQNIDLALLAKGSKSVRMSSFHNADVMRESSLKPGVKTGDQVETILELHQTVVAQ